MTRSACAFGRDLEDEDVFLAAVARSRRLHHPWVQAPRTPEAFRDYLMKRQEPRGATYFVWIDQPDGLVGVVNVDEIVRGCFLSAYLGYYAFVPYAGRGLMRQGLSQVVTQAFKTMKLHRLEANIQPARTSGRRRSSARWDSGARVYLPDI